MRYISLKSVALVLFGVSAVIIVLLTFVHVFQSSEISYQAQSGVPQVQSASAAVGAELAFGGPVEAATTSGTSSSAIPPSPAVPVKEPVTSPAPTPTPPAVTTNAVTKPAPIPVPALTVSNAVQPASSLALSGAGGVPFTNFTLSAGDQDVTVHSVSVQATGLGDVRVFDSISLNDENGDGVSDGHFDANHIAVFKDEFVVPAHTSKTMSIVGNMIGDVSPYEGEAPQLAVIAIDASEPLTGVLPIAGAAQTVNSTLTIGAATAELGQSDPGGDITRYIGDKNVKFAGIRVTANSQEDLTLASIGWKQNGTASPGDVANVTTIVNGVSYPTETDGREYTSTFSPAIVIPKGQTIDLYVMGDISNSGARRTLKFDIDSSDDVSLTGNTYGYGVGISADGNTATDGDSVFITSDGTPDGDEGTPFYSAPLVTINGGTVVNIQNAAN